MRMKPLGFTLFCVAFFGVAGFGYTKLMARIGSGTPPVEQAADQQADGIVVYKADKQMQLLRDGKVLKSYPIAMGSHWNQGHKREEGDERTPEGRYVIDWRNPKSAAHLSLHISYPNNADSEAAASENRDPGGNIMIHGLPNGWGMLAPVHLLMDWTDGCIGVTNAHMQEIWSLVPTGTPIEILAGSRKI